MVAAFFDLDKTVIAKASMVAFGGPLYRAGLLSRWLLMRALYGQLVYLWLGADEARLARMRNAALALTKGWDHEHVSAVVAETLDEVVEPIVYEEALQLIRHHRDELDQIGDEEEKANRLVELNVQEQVYNLAKTTIIQRCWKKEERPDLHGWVYGLKDGLIKSVFEMKAGTRINPIYEYDDL